MFIPVIVLEFVIAEEALLDEVEAVVIDAVELIKFVDADVVLVDPKYFS